MEVTLWNMLLALSLIHLVVTGGQPTIDEHEDNQALKMMLRESRQQNKRLEKQMNRLKLVWTGLEKMCDVLSPSCTCQSASGMSSTVSPVPGPPQAELPLRVLTASSTGDNTGNVTLTVTYTAPRVNAADWYAVYGAYNVQNIIRSGRHESLGMAKYSTSLEVPYSDPLKAALVYLSAGNETVAVEFNIDVIGSMREQSVPEYQSPILDVQFTHVAPSDGEMNVTLHIQGTLQQYETSGSSADIFLIGVSSGEGKARYFELSVFDSEFITFSGGTVANTTLEVVLTVKEPYAQMGGMLVVRMPNRQFDLQRLDGDLLRSVKYGYNMTILPPDSDQLFPANTMGMYEWPNTTMMVIPQVSLLCMAIGNPQPKMKMFRELDDGSRVAIAHETLYRDDSMALVSHTLVASERRTPGHYICRAESGSAVSEERTEVLVYSPVLFDEAKTGIIKNNTKKVVYGCKAKGQQRPELLFRLYDTNGPNLATFDKVKVKDSRIGKSGRRLTLTVSPPDYALHTVFCVSRYHGIQEYRQVELFPGEYRERDWDLYNGMNVTNFYNATNIG